MQVLQNANTVTVDKVLLANGSAGHIVGFVTMVRFLTCPCAHNMYTQSVSYQRAGLSPTKACKCYRVRPLAAQAEALQRLGCRDVVLSSELDAFRQVTKVNWSLMCSAQPVEMANAMLHSHASLQLPQSSCRITRACGAPPLIHRNPATVVLV